MRKLANLGEGEEEQGKFLAAERERVANAGDRSSLVTRLAWQKRIAAFPYYIHNTTGNFLSPVWFKDPLILLPPTMSRLYEDALQSTIWLSLLLHHHFNLIC